MVTTTLEIKASAKQIWEAITDKNAFTSWYFTIPTFSTEVGSVFEFYESEESKQFLHRCEVLETVEGSLFKHTWTHPEQSKGSSVVTWTITENGDNCALTLTHSGTETFADAGEDFTPDNFQMGWNAIILTGLRNHLVGIERLTFDEQIKATPEAIWENMWNPENYKIWTTPFCEGSYFTGELKQGGRVHFLAPDGSGMYSDVEFLKENKIVVFKHIGELKDFKEQELDEAAKLWTGCFEIYKLMVLVDGLTKLTVEMDCTKEHIAFMNNKFPLGLEKVKEMSEN
jgi:uncharacterized protein YndB with AHSA1/START domain